jgi:hypothetical protein
VADAIRSLPLLEELRVDSHVPIDDAGAEAFGCMPNLRILRLAFFGCVVTLPPGAFDRVPRLRHVHLYHVDLTNDHVASLGRLKELDHLEIDRVIDLGVYRTVTMAFPKFRFIHIENNRFIWSVDRPTLDTDGDTDGDVVTDTDTDTDMDMDADTDAVTTADSIDRPFLKCLRIDVIDAPDDQTLVSDILGRCPGLRHFQWNPIDPDSSVLAAIGRLSDLRILKLDRKIIPENVHVFTRSLRTLSRLKHLVCPDIPDIPDIPQGSMHSTDAFVRALCDLGGLRSLYATLRMPVLAGAVGRLARLEKLRVRMINDPQVVEQFIRSLDRLPALRCLEVTGEIGPTLAAPLAIAIGKLVNLQFLHMEDVHFSAFAEVGRLTDLRCLIMRTHADSVFLGGALAGALGGLTRLTRLWLPTCNPDTEAVATLAEVLATLVGLRSITLYLNADAIATIARRCFADLTSLTHLNVRYNRMGRQEVLAVAELAAQHLKYLRTFKIHGNRLTNDDYAAVSSVFGRDEIKVCA